MKNCGYRFHILVTTRDFIEGVLVRSIIPRNNPPLVLHDRVLSIIQVKCGCMEPNIRLLLLYLSFAVVTLLRCLVEICVFVSFRHGQMHSGAHPT